MANCLLAFIVMIVVRYQKLTCEMFGFQRHSKWIDTQADSVTILRPVSSEQVSGVIFPGLLDPESRRLKIGCAIVPESRGLKIGYAKNGPQSLRVIIIYI